MQNSDHKAWLDNEYAEWVKALQESTVHDFKEHPGVKRMLGDTVLEDGYFLTNLNTDLSLLHKICNIGRTKKQPFTYEDQRMIKYAYDILKRNPSSICEIGGGVGQFYAVLRALGYGNYYQINDLPEVQKFQVKYLKEVEKQTGLDLPLNPNKGPDLLVSFYALGEFDDKTKKHYEYAIDYAKHGYIAWNPHSGASDDLSLFKMHDIKVTPGIEPGISIIEW